MNIDTSKKQISVVYKNKHRLPINKQGVKEFFYDHETVVPDFTDQRADCMVNMKYFKKAVAKLREPNDNDISINLVDYERVCSSILKNKSALPYKYKKLLNYVMGIARCNRKLAIIVVKQMAEERFIKIIGEYVEYCK
jgi:hypothetical protein